MSRGDLALPLPLTIFNEGQMAPLGQHPLPLVISSSSHSATTHSAEPMTKAPGAKCTAPHTGSSLPLGRRGGVVVTRCQKCGGLAARQPQSDGTDGARIVALQFEYQHFRFLNQSVTLFKRAERGTLPLRAPPPVHAVSPRDGFHSQSSPGHECFMCNAARVRFFSRHLEPVSSTKHEKQMKRKRGTQHLICL